MPQMKHMVNIHEISKVLNLWRKLWRKNKHIEYLQLTIYVILLNFQICPKTYQTSDLGKILYGKQKSYMLNEKYFEYKIEKRN